MKRKRVGAGLRGSSDPFLTARELLKLPGDGSAGSGETGAEAPSAVTSSVGTRANAAATAAVVSLSSPLKAGRAASRKQQKLAEAAKSSRDISQYFAKKDKTEKSREEAEPQKAPDATSPSDVALDENEEAVEDAETSRVVDGIQEGSKREVIVLRDEEGDEGDAHETETSSRLREAAPEEDIPAAAE